MSNPSTLHTDSRPICNGVLDAIGSTPLVRLHRLLDDSSIQLFAKLEGCNPGGSAKDRPAKQMIEQALASGELTPDGVVIESSSGNLGVGLAQACAYYGLRFICVVDPRIQPQNAALIRAYGGELEVVREPVGGDFLSARIARVCQLLESTQDAYWPNQYSNRQNPASHAQNTAREIDESLNGEIDWLFVATSTTGTLSGCAQYFECRQRRPKLVAVDAEGSVLFGGKAGKRLLPGMGAGKTPPLARGAKPDRVVRVSDAECVRGCRQLARAEAILPGASGGGVVAAIDSMRDELVGSRVVAILHDSGARYLQTVYNDDWVRLNVQSSPAVLTPNRAPQATLQGDRL